MAEVIGRLRAGTLPGDLGLEVLVVDDESSVGTDKALATLEPDITATAL